MNTQRKADLSEYKDDSFQENERYSKTKKSSVRFSQLTAASLAGALAVYFSYSSSPWRYVLIVAFAFTAVLLIAGAVMARSVEIEESNTHKKIDLTLLTDSINKSIEESCTHKKIDLTLKEFHTCKKIDLTLLTDSINKSIEESCTHKKIDLTLLIGSINKSSERMYRKECEERARRFEHEKTFSQFYRYNPILDLHIRSVFREEMIYKHENELHRLTSELGKGMFLRNDNRLLLRMEEILSGNNRSYTHDMVKCMVNERDHDGNTPLHNAVQSEFLFAIRLLFEHGADCFIQNKKGQTPYGLSSKSCLVQDLFQGCPFVKEKIREQKYSNNIDKLLNIPQIRSRLYNNPSSFQKVPNCEGACSTLKELSVNKVLDSCRFTVS
ncbi:MAG: hypothetical protein ACRC6C_06440 [Wolbachia pipientis]